MILQKFLCSQPAFIQSSAYSIVCVSAYYFIELFLLTSNSNTWRRLHQHCTGNNTINY
jgi:hypothetical protein